MKIRPIFAWYDLWVGAFWDRKQRKLYILPLPCIGVVVEFPRVIEESPYRRLEPDPVFGSYKSLQDMHDKNAIVRAPHIKGLGPNDCPGCLWVQWRVHGSAEKRR